MRLTESFIQDFLEDSAPISVSSKQSFDPKSIAKYSSLSAPYNKVLAFVPRPTNNLSSFIPTYFLKNTQDFLPNKYFFDSETLLNVFGMLPAETYPKADHSKSPFESISISKVKIAQKI